MDQAFQVETQMTNIICHHVCFNIGFLGLGFQISCQKFGWTVGSCSRRSSSRSGGKKLKIAFMYFNLLDFFCNKVKLIYLNRNLSFEGILGLIWRLSRYGLGRPGIDSKNKHYMPSCMSKYRFIMVRISNLDQKFSWTAWILLQKV